MAAQAGPTATLDTPASTPRPATLPPGPRLPPIAQTLLWGVLPVRFFESCQRRWGSTFTTRVVGGQTTVTISDPDAVKALFGLRADDFHANEGAEVMLEPFLGRHSLLLLDGKEHQRERRLLIQAFHGHALAEYRRIIEDVTREQLGTWPRDARFALLPRMQAITLEVILQAASGIHDAARLDALRAPLREFLVRSGSFLILIPQLRRDLGRHSPWRRFVACRTAVHEVLRDEIRARRSDPTCESRLDILSVLVRARDDRGDGLSDEALLDETMTMVLAGHDTTATGLAWTFDLLLHHPAALDRLRSELAGGGDAFLDAVIKESLRLRPVIPETGRLLAHPFRVGDRELPEGAFVSANILLTHRRPDLYPDPLTFRPDRFLDADTDLFSWIPFGGGVRRCIGASFATAEMQTVLRTVINETTLQPASAKQDKPRRRVVTLVPKDGVQVVLR
jgi:cytochrome P450 family 135